MRTTFIFFFSVFLYKTGIAQNKIQFPSLTKITLDTAEQLVKKPVIFGYEPKSSTIIRKKCSDLKPTDFLYCSTDGSDVYEKVAIFKSEALKDSFFIVYDQGPSIDPSFGIYTSKGKQLKYIDALEFYINNAGTIYTAGHTDNMFNKRRKFQIQRDSLVEIFQPYYYVGLKTKTEKEISLFKTKEGKHIIATLPKGYDVEVLLCDTENNQTEKYFLLKTEFGLVGWFKLQDGASFDTGIKGLYFSGD